MKRLGMLSVLALLMGLSGVVGQAPASLSITPQAGAWFICVTCFMGDNAGALAEELATELRTQHRLNAYVFDRGQEERRKQAEEARRYKELTGGRLRQPRIQEQYAVLVGSYKDMDAARKALDGIKKVMPSEKFKLVSERMVKSEKGEAGYDYRVVEYSPFVNAFVVHNPTIPVEKPPEGPKDLDKVMKEVNLPLLRKLNSAEPNSLLKNSKQWTLVVATFQSPYENVGPAGNALTRSLNNLVGKEEDKRNASAENAQKFAEALRKLRDANQRPLNLDAYVLHTSYYSLVTVGGFDNDNDPRLRYLQTMIPNMRLLGGSTSVLAHPMPMPVPR